MTRPSPWATIRTEVAQAPCMLTFVEVRSLILIALFFVSPLLLIWGWTRWAKRPKLTSIPSILSVIGFSFATASVILAASSVAYALLIHPFPYHSPCSSGYFDGASCFLLSESCLASAASGDQVHCAGTRLVMHWERLHFGYWQPKVNRC
jgi:hypothetical protein